MSLFPPVTAELLYAYFAGQATPLQKQQIEQWLKEPAHAEFFYTCLHTWEKDNLQYQAAVIPAINQFRTKLQSKPFTSSVAAPKKKTLVVLKGNRVRWAVAASLLFILGLSASLYQSAIYYKTYTTAYGQQQIIRLADGSKVVLNANSCLQVPRFGFGNRSRQVYLTGEARFSVVHTPDDQRFVVQTDSAFKVEVLGTEFNVFARPRQTKVVLLKGKVKVHYGEPTQKQPPLTLVPGELVTLSKKKGQPEVKQVAQPENYTAWEHNRFVFENTSLTEIRNILRENYGLSVELLGPDLAQQTLSGSFKAHTADEFLLGISEVLDINVNRQNNHVLLIKNH